MVDRNTTVHEFIFNSPLFDDFDKMRIVKTPSLKRVLQRFKVLQVVMVPDGLQIMQKSAHSSLDKFLLEILFNKYVRDRVDVSRCCICIKDRGYICNLCIEKNETNHHPPKP